MEIKIKRKTGLFGGIAKVHVKVDGNTVKKLEEKEDFTIQTTSTPATIQASSGFMKSKKVNITENDRLAIQINPLCILLFLLSLVFIFIAGFIDIREIKFALSLSGLVLIACTMVYSSRGWFVLKRIEK